MCRYKLWLRNDKKKKLKAPSPKKRTLYHWLYVCCLYFYTYCMSGYLDISSPFVFPIGSLCSSFLTQCYHIPVMDSIFVRKCHRGNGLGLQMLENFVDSFKEECLGLRYPLSKAMYKGNNQPFLLVVHTEKYKGGWKISKLPRLP